MTEQLVSIIVPTYNRLDFLRATVASLLALERPAGVDYELVVVDNGGQDGSFDWLQSQTGVRSFREERPGESQARNRGIEEARGDWLAFVDDDELAEPDWLLRLWKAAQELSSRVVTGSVWLQMPEWQLTGLGPVVRQFLGEERGSARQPYRGRRLPALCNVLIHRQLFHQYGLFNTNLTVASDTEFFWRLARGHEPMWFEPAARLWHQVPAFRLEPSFLLARALWQGSYFVIILSGGHPLRGLWLAWPRALRALFWDLPGWLLNGNQDCQLRLWRAWGCCRGALAVIAPQHFGQGAFFKYLQDQARYRVDAKGSAGGE
ncbi:MAG: glycosyltransferase family A protein [Vulcanimicrobiota bacterium]